VADALNRRPLVAMVFGPLVWSAHFLLVYVGVALVCERDWALPVGPPIAGATAVALVLIALQFGLGLRTLRGTEHRASALAQRVAFQAESGMLLSAIAFVAVIYTALPVLFVPACG
jgi:hypothetical protein